MMNHNYYVVLLLLVATLSIAVAQVEKPRVEFGQEIPVIAGQPQTFQYISGLQQGDYIRLNFDDIADPFRYVLFNLTANPTSTAIPSSSSSDRVIKYLRLDFVDTTVPLFNGNLQYFSSNASEVKILQFRNDDWTDQSNENGEGLVSNPLRRVELNVTNNVYAIVQISTSARESSIAATNSVNIILSMLMTIIITLVNYS
jgi:hypothetical protein